MRCGGEWRTAVFWSPPRAPSRTLPRFAGEGAPIAALQFLSAALCAGVTLGAEDSLSREAGEGTGGGLPLASAHRP